VIHPSTTGDISESQVLAALIRAGEQVLLPFGKNRRYDLVLDRDSVFHRVQVKTGRMKDGSISFATSTVTRKSRSYVARKGYVGEIEYFGVYCPENNHVYLVPVGDVPVGIARIRAKKTRYPNGREMRWARQYRVIPR